MKKRKYEKQADLNNALVPIYVGITGHRDIENEEQIMDQIITILKRILQQYPSSPIVLLTPLAEGTDRVAAKAVNKMRLPRISYSVLLPMNENEYKATFSDETSINAYEHLKKKAIGCYQVPIKSGTQIKDVTKKEERHSKYFANMGAYLSLNTQILIAVWNGEEEKERNLCGLSDRKAVGISCASSGARCTYNNFKHGGTYHILRMRFFGIEDEYRGDESYLSNREFGPVYWIYAKRKSSGYLMIDKTIVGPIYPDFPLNFSKFDDVVTDKMCKKRVLDCFSRVEETSSTLIKRLGIHQSEIQTYGEMLSQLEHYNYDLIKQHTQLKLKMIASEKYLGTYFPKDGEEEVFNFHSQEGVLVDHYKAADSMSGLFRDKRKHQIIALVLIALIGLLYFNLYSGPLPNNWFIMSYSMTYFVGTMYYLLRVKSCRYHEKYQNYRGIAEALRVQLFWSLGGVEAEVTQYYLNNQKSTIEWIRVAINNVVMLYKAQTNGHLNLAKNRELVSKLWLINQSKYYAEKAPQKKKIDFNQTRLAQFLFGIAFLVAIGLTAFDFAEFIYFRTCGTNSPIAPFIKAYPYEAVHKWFVFLVGFIPVIIASTKVFTELMAYSKLARNYAWMRMVYRLAVHEYQRITINHMHEEEILEVKVKKLLYDVGKEALLENGEWIGIIQERVPELPK